MMRPRSGCGVFERLGETFSSDELEVLRNKADERNTRGYRMCGRLLRLRCDHADYADRFERAFHQLRCEDAQPAACVSELTFLTRQAGPDGFPALIDARDQRIRVFEHEEVLPTQLFTCLAFMEKRMFSLPDHLVLHGAAIEHRGAVTAIVGRTYSGKSTLGLRLALEPNIAFLSDEFCPIRLNDGVVDPFPRCLGLRRHACSFLAAKGALAPDLTDSAAPQVEVDPTSVRGLTIGRGGPIRNLVILSGEGVSDLTSNARLMDLQFVNAAVLADLRAIAGVRAVEVLDDGIGIGVAVRIEVEKGARVAGALIRVCRDIHRMQCCGFLPAGACRPDFANPPSLAPLASLRAMLEAARHLFNYGALEIRLGPGHSRLMDCLAARLGNVRFFSLQPGPLEETSRLVQRAVLET